jgi:hypothetical protein
MMKRMMIMQEHSFPVYRSVKADIHRVPQGLCAFT